MKIENIKVFGFEPAFHGMRNPLDSWDKSDSTFYTGPWGSNPLVPERPIIGPEDLKLACKLVKAGTDHRKFMRQIMIWWDITLPRCVWQEYDTYKVSTVRNSCSTMNKLGKRDLTHDDFEDGIVMEEVLRLINDVSELARAGKRTPENIQHMKMLLPESFLQMSTCSLSYETALSMYRSRKNHRMKQWSGPGGICEVIASLPYMGDFIKAMEGDK